MDINSIVLTDKGWSDEFGTEQFFYICQYYGKFLYILVMICCHGIRVFMANSCTLCEFYSVCKEDADCIDDHKPKCDAATGKCGKGSL